MIALDMGLHGYVTVHDERLSSDTGDAYLP